MLNFLIQAWLYCIRDPKNMQSMLNDGADLDDTLVLTTLRIISVFHYNFFTKAMGHGKDFPTGGAISIFASLLVNAVGCLYHFYKAQSVSEDDCGNLKKFAKELAAITPNNDVINTFLQNVEALEKDPKNSQLEQIVKNQAKNVIEQIKIIVEKHHLFSTDEIKDDPEDMYIKIKKIDANDQQHHEPEKTFLSSSINCLAIIFNSSVTIAAHFWVMYARSLILLGVEKVNLLAKDTSIANTAFRANLVSLTWPGIVVGIPTLFSIGNSIHSLFKKAPAEDKDEENKLKTLKMRTLISETIEKEKNTAISKYQKLTDDKFPKNLHRAFNGLEEAQENSIAISMPFNGKADVISYCSTTTIPKKSLEIGVASLGTLRSVFCDLFLVCWYLSSWVTIFAKSSSNNKLAEDVNGQTSAYFTGFVSLFFAVLASIYTGYQTHLEQNKRNERTQKVLGAPHLHNRKEKIEQEIHIKLEDIKVENKEDIQEENDEHLIDVNLKDEKIEEKNTIADNINELKNEADSLLRNAKVLHNKTKDLLNQYNRMAGEAKELKASDYLPSLDKINTNFDALEQYFNTITKLAIFDATVKYYGKACNAVYLYRLRYNVFNIDEVPQLEHTPGTIPVLIPTLLLYWLDNSIKQRNTAIGNLLDCPDLYIQLLKSYIEQLNSATDTLKNNYDYLSKAVPALKEQQKPENQQSLLSNYQPIRLFF